MLTRETKQRLLRRVMNVGCHVTALEGDACIYGVAKLEIAELKAALEKVRATIANAEEPGQGQRASGGAMRPNYRGD